MPADKAWAVKFAAGALEDLVEIIRYLLENEGANSARELAALLQNAAQERLAALPQRGHLVPELECTGQDCREIHVKSYRIIYQASEAERIVWILLVAHFRQSVQDMLRKRLLHCPARG